MANCYYCDSFLLFGGVKAGNLTFCNAKCQQGAYYQAIASKIPENTLLDVIQRLNQEGCPKCGTPGQVEVFTSHTVWSALVLTSWKSTPAISCRRCAVIKQGESAVLSMFVGWWGFPWGLIMTPVQVTRNIAGMIKKPTHPSPQLKRIVSLNLAAQLVAQQHSQKPPPVPPHQGLPPLPTSAP